MEFVIEHANRGTRPLDFLAEGYGGMKKIYCTCGRIVDIDDTYFKRRMNLGKQVECSVCRNARVSREIEDLNNHFLGISEEECLVSDLL